MVIVILCNMSPFCLYNQISVLNVRYIYCSSAGVYLKSDLLPHAEVSLHLITPFFTRFQDIYCDDANVWVL